jgi:hypothetical protein
VVDAGIPASHQEFDEGDAGRSEDLISGIVAKIPA